MKLEESNEEDFHGNGEKRNLSSLRADNELFNEEDYVPHKIINAKRVRLPRKGEDWEVLEDGEVVLVMKGTRFTKSEKEFLRTAEGMRFIIDEYKAGKKSVVKIKDELKKVLK